jgi:hypothetical protein
MDLTEEQADSLMRLARKLGGEPGVWISSDIAKVLQAQGLARHDSKHGWMITNRGLSALQKIRLQKSA